MYLLVILLTHLIPKHKRAQSFCALVLLKNQWCGAKRRTTDFWGLMSFFLTGKGVIKDKPKFVRLLPFGEKSYKFG